MMIPANDLVQLFRRMYLEHWKYTWGHAAEGDVDCSGAFVWAYRQFGLSIYHGSNAIARQYIVRLLPVSQARPGMAAFKYRKPGQKYYDLPPRYQQGGSAYNGDLNDYHHIGLVDETGKAVYNAQSPSAGFGKSAVSKWGFVAELKAVDYEDTDDGGKTEMETMYVTAESGKTVRMREKPSTSARIIAEIPIGTEVRAGADIDGWRQIIRGDEGGYMMSKFLTPDSPDVRYTVKCYGMTWRQVMQIRETCPTAEVIKEVTT